MSSTRIDWPVENEAPTTRTPSWFPAAGVIVTETDCHEPVAVSDVFFVLTIRPLWRSSNTRRTVRAARRRHPGLAGVGATLGSSPPSRVSR